MDTLTLVLSLLQVLLGNPSGNSAANSASINNVETNFLQKDKLKAKTPNDHSIIMLGGTGTWGENGVTSTKQINN